MQKQLLNMLSRYFKLFLVKELSKEQNNEAYSLLLNLNYWFWRVKRIVLQTRERNRWKQNTERASPYDIGIGSLQNCNNGAWKRKREMNLTLPVNTVMHWSSLFFLLISITNYQFSWIEHTRKAQRWRGLWWGSTFRGSMDFTHRIMTISDCLFQSACSYQHKDFRDLITSISWSLE